MESALTQKLIDLRRDLHRHPESGWTEYYTTARIIDILQKEGIYVRSGRSLHTPAAMFGMPSDAVMENAWQNALSLIGDVQLLSPMRGGFTGCVAEIRGALPGNMTVFRVDIDACELEECHDNSHPPAALGFDSVHRSLMHACGHDAHAAIGVGAALLLQQNRENLHGTVRIIFQPAEEGLRGAASMIKAGLLHGCSHLIGLHVGLHDLSIGTVAAACTNFLSGTKLDVFFHGKAAHAGICPELGRNALAAAAKASLALLDLPNQLDGTCRVNVGTFHAGSGRNVIPAEAHIAIETRADDADKNRLLQATAQSICKAAADEYGCSVETRYMGGSNAAYCDTSLAEEIIDILKTMLQIKEILPSIPFGGGEDITTMMQYVQDHGGRATELLLGMPLIAPHHSDKFDIDEAVIPLGAEILTQIALCLD